MAGAVKVVVKVTAKPDAVGKVRAIVLELAAQSRKENGCVSYDVLQNNSEPEVFVLYEEWTDNAALDAHNKMPHFFAAVTQAQTLLAKPLDVGRYAAIA